MLSGSKRRIITGLSLWLGLWSQPEGASAACDEDCAGDLACEQRAVACLRARGQGRLAIERLKAAVAQYPERTALARLLAATYQAEGNTFWAQRTLNRLIERDPRDCASRAWLAWLYLQQGDLDLAEEVLVGPACPATGPERARWPLLRLLIARARQDPEASRRALAELSVAPALYREDARALARLRRELDPTWRPPFHVRAELSGGATSHASAGLPTTQARTEVGSLLSRLDLFGRISGPAGTGMRPVTELGLRGHYLERFDAEQREAVRSGRYLEFFLRPGLVLGSGAWRSAVGYRVDVFVLNQGDAYTDAPQIYHEGHRAEWELETPGGLTVFAGAGRRLFRRRARSRWEVDGGAGWSTAPLGGMRLLMAVSLRRYLAEADAYSHTGGTLLAVSRWQLPGDRYLRVGAILGRDRYQDTAAALGGRDLLAKSSLQLWAPVRQGVQLGVVHEFTRRASSASVSYSYSEHRGLLKLRLVFDLDPLGPAVVGPQGRIPLPVVGSAAGIGLDEERIRDLLQQDEAARRSSSCAN
jgi:tetratricopeptide (TPR) repeat protein